MCMIHVRVGTDVCIDSSGCLTTPTGERFWVLQYTYMYSVYNIILLVPYTCTVDVLCVCMGWAHRVLSAIKTFLYRNLTMRNPMGYSLSGESHMCDTTRFVLPTSVLLCHRLCTVPGEYTHLLLHTRALRFSLSKTLAGTSLMAFH